MQRNKMIGETPTCCSERRGQQSREAAADGVEWRTPARPYQYLPAIRETVTGVTSHWSIMWQYTGTEAHLPGGFHGACEKDQFACGSLGQADRSNK
jgi:hypothetical protein